MKNITLSIVEDQKLMAKSLSKMINESDAIRVLSVYYDLKSCYEGLLKESPDILLLDIGLPDGDGVDFCAEVTKLYPALKVIILTGYKEFNIVKHALLNGASGYILKNAEPAEMFAGIEAVTRGEQFLCDEIDLLLKDKKEAGIIWLLPTAKK
jgi:DNA-binding NarL/FixJ family response regulator